MKYEFTGEVSVWFGITIKRIRRIKDQHVGGWVETEQNLAQVGGDAWVDGNARVVGNARVDGNARVVGNARVDGNAQVGGDARVDGNARVGGDARVSLKIHVRCIGPIGSREDTITLFKTEKSWSVAAGCWLGTLPAFEKRVKEVHGDNKHGQEYGLAIALFKSWTSEAEVAAEQS